LNETISKISGNEDESRKQKVRGKIETFISNIENDIKSSGSNDFEIIKRKLSSKYKNLPVKFHYYLDEIIRWKINELTL
jgi:hypothetical protein